MLGSACACGEEGSSLNPMTLRTLLLLRGIQQRSSTSFLDCILPPPAPPLPLCQIRHLWFNLWEVGSTTIRFILPRSFSARVVKKYPSSTLQAAELVNMVSGRESTHPSELA